MLINDYRQEILLTDRKLIRSKEAKSKHMMPFKTRLPNDLLVSDDGDRSTFAYNGRCLIENLRRVRFQENRTLSLVEQS